MEAGFGDSSSKRPPTWNAEQRQYKFLDYIRDVRLWCAACELRPTQMGPAIAMRLTGEARDVIRDLDPMELMNGRPAPDGINIIPGSEIILQELANRFGPMVQHHALATMEEFMSFKRAKGEPADRTISRFNDTYRRAVREGGLQMNSTTVAYLLTQALQLTSEELLVLLHDFGGAMPNDQHQYNTFIERVRLHLQRQDRVREGRAPLNFAGDHRPAQPQYPLWEATDIDDPYDQSQPYEDEWYAGAYPSWEDEHYEDFDYDYYDPQLEMEEEETHLGEEPSATITTEASDEAEAYLIYLAARREFRRHKGKGKGASWPSPFHRPKGKGKSKPKGFGKKDGKGKLKKGFAFSGNPN
eukprot:5584632-Amphidinium_carterae.3